MKLKVGNYKIKHHYTIVRLIIDSASAGLLYLIWQTLISLAIAAEEINNRFLSNSANASGIRLSWYPALILPVLAVFTVAFSLIFVFKSRPLPKKYVITERTAQRYYDFLAAAAGLIRAVILLGIFDMVYIQSMLILNMGGGFISIQVICDSILIIIIIKFTSYKISVLSKNEAEEIKKEKHITEN